MISSYVMGTQWRVFVYSKDMSLVLSKREFGSHHEAMSYYFYGNDSDFVAKLFFF